ncbi:uncharacterized protein SPPG_02477 [Spizellomyces punctatus DAOM BR117]|uniref:Uncharacterized protein n=1 Tax=Spizellomyces punctatus (strain DAOM BR117) TaxID=645134 RepID=A0A0L0HM25_SPIPD|nr:uncharacterized protein SPPG_02477 [Spizellomyces punctatus DAOM BR117]KND01970.1 hypothetical protein SPPG_02477 [Spizellomyces punctatus DAOM BR117]|eukprot:XP_016610009.1 hypothetical protein SPPG_02477 [Spizellomyces punctatus DAOM BR117]
MDTLTFSPPAAIYQEHGRHSPPICRKRKLIEGNGVEENGKSKRLHVGPCPNTPPFTMPFFPPPAEMSCNGNVMQWPVPGIDPHLLQQQLAELQKALPGPTFGISDIQQRHVDRRLEPLMDIYDFGKVHERLLACGESEPMLLDEIPPSLQSSSRPNLRRSSSDMSLCTSPSHHISQSVSLYTPVPSPQRSPGRAPGSAPMSPGMHRQIFSMGFRRDCDKCRMGVPGHYMHVMQR